MKSSKEELDKRKQAHQSKNIDLVKYEKQQQLMSKVSKNKTQLALLKEILYDDEQLKNLINKSDSTLKTVQDFFSLDPENNHSNKKQPKINMTLAPNVTDLNESNLPFNNTSLKKKQTNTITTTAKVNTLNDDASESESESEILNLKIKQAKQENDVEKYKKLLQLKQDLITKKLNDPNLLKPLPLQQHELNNQSLLNQVNEDLKKCLIDLESKLYEFDKPYGKYNTTSCAKTTHSTCTQTLIKIIACLFDYIKDIRADLNYEKLVAQETNKQMDIHRKLIDGLTNEILLVKEQNEKLFIENSNLENKFNVELDQIKELIRNQFVSMQNPPNIIDLKPSRPSAFKSHEQQQQQRPMSCISYQSFNSSSKDKFTERINAMLQNDLDMDKLRQRPSTSTSNLDISNLLNTNKQIMTDFNHQLLELTNKNNQAQHKLKMIQSDYVPPKETSRDLALEKLKQEQELIKEQINLLNKQRESAQIELEVLSLTSSSTNLNSKMNGNINKKSPSLSPISLNENIYSDAKI